MNCLFLIAAGALELVMRLLGVTVPEMVSEDEYEHYCHYLEHPLQINLVSGDRMVSSGLLSPYQAASLADYRERHGDVLSFAELSSVDGFSDAFVARAAPFMSLDSNSLPGKTSFGKERMANEASARGGLKMNGGDSSWSYGMKYRFSYGDRYEAGLAFPKGYADKVPWPESGSFFAAFYGKKHLSGIVAGDYNLRFGQGLALWTGFSMSGVGTPSSLLRRPSGVSPYRSWTGEGSCRGVAAEMRFGRFGITASLAFGGLRDMMSGKKGACLALNPSLNAGWRWRNWQASMTCTAATAGLESLSDRTVPGIFTDMKVSGDFSCCIRGTDIFGEMALDVLSMKPAAVFGSRFRCGEALVLAVCGRYYPAAYSGKNSGAVRSGSRCSNEHGLSVTGEFAAGNRVSLKGREGFGSSVRRHDGSFSMDVAFFPEKSSVMPPGSVQVRSSLDYNVFVSPSVALSFRLAERFRNKSPSKCRTDARADVKYTYGSWNATFRFNALYGRNLSMLTYAEGGYRNGRFSFYARAGAFKADDWDDRIYVYERDAPGTFNVPALYGRGYWVSASAGAKCARWLKAYLRASLTEYPWMPEGKEKPGKAELKLQFMFSF